MERKNRNERKKETCEKIIKAIPSDYLEYLAQRYEESIGIVYSTGGKLFSDKKAAEDYAKTLEVFPFVLPIKLSRPVKNGHIFAFDESEDIIYKAYATKKELRADWLKDMDGKHSPWTEKGSCKGMKWEIDEQLGRYIGPQEKFDDEVDEEED